MDITSEGNSKINAQYFSICDVDQKVVQVTITDSNQVGGNTENGHALDELVFDCQECRTGKTKVLQSIPQELSWERSGMFPECFDNSFLVQFEELLVQFSVVEVLSILVSGSINQPI